VADLLKMILDQAIVVGLAALGAAIFSWTGAGAALSLMFATYECRRIMDLWGEATNWLSKTQLSIEALVGFLQSQEAHVLDEIRPVAMPAVGYDHPGVRVEPVGPGMKGQ
jgi:hypothetical protein